VRFQGGRGGSPAIDRRGASRQGWSQSACDSSLQSSRDTCGGIKSSVDKVADFGYFLQGTTRDVCIYLEFIVVAVETLMREGCFARKDVLHLDRALLIRCARSDVRSLVLGPILKGLQHDPS